MLSQSYNAYGTKNEVNSYKANGIANEHKLVNGTNNINHNVEDLLASNIILITDLIGFIYFYFPS